MSAACAAAEAAAHRAVVFKGLRRSANYASGANNQSTVLANLELYRTTFGNNNYPDRFDSLLDASGAVPAFMNSELRAMITPGTLDTAQFQCLNNNNRGMISVMDHVDPGTSGVIQGNPGNTGTIVRPLAAGTGNFAFVNTSVGNGQTLARALYPDGAVPADVSLVLMGVGPSMTANGRTMQAPPFDTNLDNSLEYGRFIAVFAVYSPRQGRRAQLKAVLCPRGRIVTSNLSEFYQSTNPE
jgi:hypothetical protein